MRDKVILILLALLFVASLAIGLVAITRSPERTADAELDAWSRLLGGAPNAIGIVRTEGTISYRHGPGMPTLGLADGDKIAERLLKLGSSERVRAVVLRINSSGGTIAATQGIHDAVEQVRTTYGKPVVASLADMATSGGYYVAAGADHIVSAPGTITGSIGAIVGKFNASELMKQWGLDVEIVASGSHKDMMAMWRGLSEEERTFLREAVTVAHEQFVTAVVEGRKLPRDQVLKLADGRVFLGEQALKAGLVDSLGGLQDAIREAAALAGFKGEVPTVLEDRRFPFADVIELLELNVASPWTGVGLGRAGLQTGQLAAVPILYHYGNGLY